jgi:NodT family efflux transporter outer membrane factor (OMF) lipoprotein
MSQARMMLEGREADQGWRRPNRESARIPSWAVQRASPACTRTRRPACIRAGRILAATLALILAVTLTGCAGPAARLQRPAPPVADAFPDAISDVPGGRTASPGPAAIALPWRSFVADERLRLLVDEALGNNRDLRAAVLNVELARAQVDSQRADLWPSVGVGAGASRAPNASGHEGNAFTAGLSVSAFELDLFGRVKSLGDAAAARYLASDEGRRAAQLSLVAAVVSADLALRADDALVDVTQRTLDSRLESLRLIRLRFDGGAAAEPELRSGESLVAAASANLIALQRQQRLDRNALVLLLGSALPPALPAGQPLADVAFADLPVGLPSDVLLQRPDVRQAEQQLLAAEASISAARASFFPRITLTGSAGFASSELKALFDQPAAGLSAQLLQPLFDAGRNRANLAAAQAAREIALAQYEKTVQSAFREVADALAGRSTLARQLEAQQAQADAEARRLQLAELLFQGGAASQLDRLDAERSALAARQAVVQLQLARLQNAVLLYRVLGGGA